MSRGLAFLFRLPAIARGPRPPQLGPQRVGIGEHPNSHRPDFEVAFLARHTRVYGHAMAAIGMGAGIGDGGAVMNLLPALVAEADQAVVGELQLFPLFRTLELEIDLAQLDPRPTHLGEPAGIVEAAQLLQALVPGQALLIAGGAHQLAFDTEELARRMAVFLEPVGVDLSQG